MRQDQTPRGAGLAVPWAGPHGVRRASGGAALSRQETVRVTAACTACGACLATCPEAALRKAPKRPDVLDAACTACWACIEICPAGAIVEALAPWPAGTRGEPSGEPGVIEAPAVVA